MRTNIYKIVLSNLNEYKHGCEAKLSCVTNEIEALNNQYQEGFGRYVLETFEPRLTYLTTTNRKTTEEVADNYRPTGEIISRFESSDKYMLMWRGNITYFTLLNYCLTKSNQEDNAYSYKRDMPTLKRLIEGEKQQFLSNIILYNDKKVLAYSTDY